MLVKIPAVLSPDQVQQMRERLLAAEWVEGRVTAGPQSARCKHNLQLPQQSAEARQLGDIILAALAQNSLFMSAALPGKIFPPMFNCYQHGGHFGTHVDNAIRTVPGTPVKIRTDLSLTLFLSDPDEYQGGELVIEDTYGRHSVKLPAGDLVLYPATSLHQVMPVTRGRRLAAFFWLQSMVRSDEQRRVLFELDRSIQALSQQLPESPEWVRLTAVYHNLIRQWADT